MIKRTLCCLLVGVTLFLIGCSHSDTITSQPTTVPTTVPTTIPTTVPTTAPTITTTLPTTVPTVPPTTIPTTVPTTNPTTVPTTNPTTVSTSPHTTNPSFVPTAPITVKPTVVPVVTPDSASWVTENGKTFYLLDGQKATGWLDIGSDRYYFGKDGAMQTGWLKFDGNRYFFHEDGTMAVGKVAVSDTEYAYFLKNGQQILVVNPWNLLPDSYTVKTVVYTSNRSVAEVCYEPLSRMIADCMEAIGGKVKIRSAYRTPSDQKYLFMNKVKALKEQGLSQEEAEIEAAKVVAIPGTSEHQLGLAVDLTDASYDKLNEKQEQMPVQKWLMEHCWEYGFILRYPNGKTEKTGIIYEPWHYRYVGVELAMEMKDSGLCLEEYLEQISK